MPSLVDTGPVVRGKEVECENENDNKDKNRQQTNFNVEISFVPLAIK